MCFVNLFSKKVKLTYKNLSNQIVNKGRDFDCTIFVLSKLILLVQSLQQKVSFNNFTRFVQCNAL